MAAPKKNTTTPKTTKQKQIVNPVLESDFDDQQTEQEPVQRQNSAPRRENSSEGRSPLNHAKDSSTSEEIGGMSFRRNRAALDHSSKATLDINKELLNDELRYRWVNDSNGRIENLRETGYEVVDQASFAKGEAITTRRRVGTNKDGSALFAVLMATPKKWFDERQAQSEKARSENERGMVSGKTDGKEKLDDGFYQKGGTISRSR